MRSNVGGSCLLFFALSLAVLCLGQSGEKSEIRTFTYKKVANLEIKADVLRASDERVRPIIIFIHGGALINGSRAGSELNPLMKEIFLGAGYVIVSLDYRLAPETKLPEILQDIEDGIAWVRRDGSQLFRADTRRIAVVGSSAGGYLTLTAGFRVKPRPDVLVSFWGYGDLIGEWLTKPSRYPRHWKVTMSEEDAKKLAAGPPVSNAGDRKGDGSAFARFCRQKGEWPKSISGWDPQAEAENFKPYMAFHNVSQDYPPTLLIHGSNDTDVPYEQSLLMSVQFTKLRIEHQLIPLCGQEHGFGGKDDQMLRSMFQSAIAFIDRHVKNSK